MVTIHHAEERRHIHDRRSTSTRANKSRMTALDRIAMALVIVGGLNWGLIGLFSFDLVAALFGTMSWFTRLVHILVGASALYMIYTSTKISGKKR